MTLKARAKPTPAQSMPTSRAEEASERYHDAEWGAERLSEIPIFSPFSHDELKRLYNVGSVHSIRAKTHIIIEGEPTRGMYVILAGSVSVYKSDSTSASLTRLAILGEAAAFGEITLFDQAPRSATVVAEARCWVFHLPAEVLEHFLASEPPDVSVRFYRRCVEELAGRVRAMNSDYISSQRLLWQHALRRS